MKELKENEKKIVRVLDAIMGSGKTYDAIERMKKHNGNFMYVTPFLKEVERIVESVPGVFDPKVTYDYNPIEDEYTTIYKRDNLLRMANKEINMATTHSLFQLLHRNDYSHFTNYDLILDEVLTPVKVLGITSADIQIAFNEGLLVENIENGQVTFTGDDYSGKFYMELKKYCDTSNVIYVNGRLLVWAFPPEIFKKFKSVTVLTYLFEGSLLASYFKYYNIPYKCIKSSIENEIIKKKELQKLLNIYEGPANKIGNYSYSFSVNWLKNKSNSDLKSISKSVENLVKRNFKTSSELNCYTTFKAYNNKLKGKGYTKGFISVNERATNKYSDKKTMIYLANKFLNPNYVDFFRTRNIIVNQEEWALAELIQWVWRGCIRKNEPMNLFIPSVRMRRLLLNWLENRNWKLNVLVA